MSRKSQHIDRRVARAAEAELAERKAVAPIDVLTRIGWLTPTAIDSWRKGRVADLTELAAVPEPRLVTAIELLQSWAASHGLISSDVSYVAATRDRHTLRFCANGDETVERMFRTHWTPAELSEAKREQITQRQSAAPDLVVIMPLKEFTCTGCGGTGIEETGSLLIMEGAGPICLVCADMAHLVFLPSGDAALTRRAKKASGLSAVVVRFSRSRKRYERQGLLVEPAALDQAEEQCLADEELRARRRDRDRVRREAGDLDFQARLAQEIVRLFPRCPADRAEIIARHTGLRGSGRVGRSALGQALDEGAVTAAVVASVRHTDTRYDELLMSGVPRAEARDRVRAQIDRVLERWSARSRSR